jgi:UDP-N-acetylglucosamine 1-carboxyvinyltransferase
MAVCARGDSVICGGACEPHIDALIDFLISCGADISRSGEDLYIRGAELHGGSITVIGDMIEAGSYITAGLITDGDVLVRNCPTADMGAIFDAFSNLGATLQITDDTVRARMGEKGRCASVIATPYPGFPTDLQPIFAPLMAALLGGKIIDTVWPSRFGYLEALSNFGIKYSLNENTAVIYPSDIMNGYAVSPDLRGGMACLIAALRAKGESEISSVEIIQRGYENLVEKLCALGAEIEYKR